MVIALRACTALLFGATASGAYNFDVVVYDATSAGVMAAYAAASHGVKVALVCASYPACFEEGGRIVGGMSAGGLGQTDIGSHSDIIGGFAREFYRRNRKHYSTQVESAWNDRASGDNCRLPSAACDVTFNLEPRVAQSIFEGLLQEAGVHIIYGQQVKNVTKLRLSQVPNLHAATDTLFTKYAGMNCLGTGPDLERDLKGSAEDCKTKCLSVEGCVGFVRVNGGSDYAGACFLRSGGLSTPTPYVADERDCFALQQPTCDSFACPSALVPRPGSESIQCGAACDASTCCELTGGNALRALTLTSGETLTAHVFIDASYEGDLFAAAGASFRIGREAKSEYNESLAGRQAGATGNEMSVTVDPFLGSSATLPLVEARGLGQPGDADELIQAYNFRLCVTNNESLRVPFPRPANYQAEDWELLRRYVKACGIDRNCQIGFPSCNMGRVPNEKYDMNNCGAVSTDYIGQNYEYPRGSPSKRKDIWQAHRDYTEGLLWTLGNDPEVPSSVRGEMAAWGLCGDEFESTGHFPPALYIREARRLLGDDVFTQNSPKAGGVGELSIGLGNYNFDSHNAQRFVCQSKEACYGAGPSDAGSGPYVWVEGDVQVAPGIYEIPYWVVLPKRSELSNLLVVGAPSASHVGMSTLRMEPQFMILGHSAGVAAALAVEEGSGVHDVNLTELQRRLLADGQLLTQSSFEDLLI